MASPASNWPEVASSTERPASSSPRPPRQLCVAGAPCVTSVLSATTCRGSEIARSATGPRWSLSANTSRGDILIGPDEVAYRMGEGSILGERDRIGAEIILEARDQDSKRERVKAGLMEREIVGERRQGDLLLLGNLLDRCNDPQPHRHG